jgi:hypothetical protein
MGPHTGQVDIRLKLHMITKSVSFKERNRVLFLSLLLKMQWLELQLELIQEVI